MEQKEVLRIFYIKSVYFLACVAKTLQTQANIFFIIFEYLF